MDDDFKKNMDAIQQGFLQNIAQGLEKLKNPPAVKHCKNENCDNIPDVDGIWCDDCYEQAEKLSKNLLGFGLGLLAGLSEKYGKPE